MNTGLVLGVGCLAVIALFLVGWVVWTVAIMLIWNFILAPAFNLTTLTWLQAFGIGVILTIVSNLLTSGRN